MRSYYFAFLVVCLFFSLSYCFLHLSNKPVENIIIQGNLSLDESILLRGRLEAEFQGRILDVDLFNLINKVKDDFQWIHSIGVDRDWPATLVLKVEKIAPIAKWSQGLYISSQGQIIELESDRKSLPEFKVALSSPTKSMEVFRDLTGKLRSINLGILEISENPLGEWSIELSNGLNVELGHDHLDTRLIKSLSVYNSLDRAAQAQLGCIDARYIGGVALKKAGVEDSGSSFLLSNID